MNDMAYLCDDAVARAGSLASRGRPIAQPPPASEHQQRPDYQRPIDLALEWIDR